MLGLQHPLVPRSPLTLLAAQTRRRRLELSTDLSVFLPRRSISFRAAREKIQPRKTTTWSALDGETFISLSPGHPHQQLIDKHLAQAGVKVKIGPIVNLLDTQIALVEAAEEGIAIIPSFGMPACRNRRITTSQLINPVARFDFHMISRRGGVLPQGAGEFTSFLKSYIATWAGARRRALICHINVSVIHILTWISEQRHDELALTAASGVHAPKTVTMSHAQLNRFGAITRVRDHRLRTMPEAPRFLSRGFYFNDQK